MTTRLKFLCDRRQGLGGRPLIVSPVVVGELIESAVGALDVLIVDTVDVSGEIGDRELGSSRSRSSHEVESGNSLVKLNDHVPRAVSRCRVGLHLARDDFSVEVDHRLHFVGGNGTRDFNYFKRLSGFGPVSEVEAGVVALFELGEVFSSSRVADYLNEVSTAGLGDDTVVSLVSTHEGDSLEAVVSSLETGDLSLQVRGPGSHVTVSVLVIAILKVVDFS